MSDASKMPSLLGGVMIIAGTIIGAGMFANPIAMAGVWWYGSLLTLVFTWAFMLASGLFLLEVNLLYPQGASFDTIVKDLLGKIMNIVNGLSVAFVLYTLTYAYITSSSDMVIQSFKPLLATSDANTLESLRQVTAVVITLVAGFCVWLSTRAVDRFTTVLIFGMVITFLLMLGGLLPEIHLAKLTDQGGDLPYYAVYVLSALPVCLASFGFHGNVPSLVIYYRKDGKRVAKSLFWGSFLALILYIFWQMAIYGNLPRHEFAKLPGNAGISHLIQALSTYIAVDLVNQFVNLFAYMAIISSFLGVTLGLFDYLADLFHFDDSGLGRAKSAMVTFLPPLIGSIIAPFGFVTVISYVGLAATIWAVMVPALLAWAARRRGMQSPFRVPGGNFLIFMVIFAGLLNIFAQFATQLGWVRIFGH